MNCLFKRVVILVVALTSFGLVAANIVVAERLPEKTVGAAECAECHKKEGQIWERTHHARTFKELHRKKEAKAISKKMGISRMKQESTCLTCHYTTQMKGGKEVAISGIGCESCHGAAKDWLNLHNTYGGKDIKKEAESAAHKAKRLSETKEKGMIRPDTIYELAQNCYQCHTVPNEKLVNVGGHKPGSNFELVSWLQGEVRHNVFTSKENTPSSPERRRLLYVVGRALDLEYAFRGVAKSTQKATYAVKMAKRAAKSIKTLKAVNAKVSIPEIQQMVKLADAAKLKLNNEKNLLAAADKVGALTKQFLKNNSKADLSAIDALIPKGTKGKPAA